MPKFLLLTFLTLASSALVLAAVNSNETAERGEEVYRVTCATGYCHGVNGETAGAPRLVARSFDIAYIRTVISNGVDKTSMPGFAQTLPREDLIAVMTYVAALNDIQNPEFFQSGGLGVAAATAPRSLGEQATRGRELFIDSAIGVERCSTCHELEGLGIPVASPIMRIPASVGALRSLRPERIQQITVQTETMPGLMVANTVSGILFYDLATAPPVLRTLDAGTPLQTSTSTWSHENFVSAYDDGELQAILSYLAAVIE